MAPECELSDLLLLSELRRPELSRPVLLVGQGFNNFFGGTGKFALLDPFPAPG